MLLQLVQLKILHYCLDSPVLPKFSSTICRPPVKISKLPGVLSYHTTYTLFPDVATAGSSELNALLLRLTVAPKLAPPSVDLRYKMSPFPGLSSCQITFTLSPDIATAGLAESPPLLLRLTMSYLHNVIIYIRISWLSSLRRACKKSSDQIHLSPNSLIFAYMC